MVGRLLWVKNQGAGGVEVEARIVSRPPVVKLPNAGDPAWREGATRFVWLEQEVTIS